MRFEPRLGKGCHSPRARSDVAQPRSGQGLYLRWVSGRGRYCFSGKEGQKETTSQKAVSLPRAPVMGSSPLPPNCPERPLQSWPSHGPCLPLPSVVGCSKEIVEIHSPFPHPPPPLTHTQHIPLGPQRKTLGAKGFHGQRIPRCEMKHRGPR